MPLEVIDELQSVAEHVDHATNRPDIGRRQVGFSIDETDQLLQGVEKPGVAEIGEPGRELCARQQVFDDELMTGRDAGLAA